MSEQFIPKADAALVVELEATYNIELFHVKDSFYKIYRGGIQHGFFDGDNFHYIIKLHDIKLVLDEYTANIDPDYYTKELCADEQ